MGDEREDQPIEQYEQWKRGESAEELQPAERLSKTSHIALLLSYDLIDKIRFWEKESLKLPVAEIEQRHEHMRKFMDKLRDAYLTFTELEP